MTVVGETWVRILPETTEFTPLLTEEVVAGSEKAGAAGGVAAGSSFGKSFGSALKSSLALVGIGAGLVLVKDSIQAASEHAGAVAVLDKATQNARASNELYGASLESVIRKEAILKGFNDESLYQSFTRLVGVTHDSTKAFGDLQLAEDVARGRHIDVAVAALALTKAEQGSVTSLQRLGIVIPKSITPASRRGEGDGRARTRPGPVRRRGEGLRRLAGRVDGASVRGRPRSHGGVRRGAATGSLRSLEGTLELPLESGRTSTGSRRTSRRAATRSPLSRMASARRSRSPTRRSSRSSRRSADSGRWPRSSSAPCSCGRRSRRPAR